MHISSIILHACEKEERRNLTGNIKVIHHIRQLLRIHIGRIDERFVLRGADQGELVAAGWDGEIFAASKRRE